MASQLQENPPGVSKSSFGLLYLAYAISCVGDRIWTFAIVFVLQDLGGLRLVGINQLVEAVSAMVLVSFIGHWLDKHDRRVGMLSVLTVNNVSVAISASLLAICLSMGPGLGYTTLLGLSVLFCAISKCASEGERLAFTKDWIVVMAGTDNSAGSLSRRNSTLTTIDQLSSVIAPIVTGYVLQYFGHRTACFVFVGWNLVSWLVERQLLNAVYRSVPNLTRPLIKDVSKPLDTESDDDSNAECQKDVSCSVFAAYWRQTVFPAAFGLALLYMTVLGFDGIAISHGKTQGMSEDVLGMFRAAGSVLGIVGAIIYRYSEPLLGVRRVGFLGLLLQQMCLWLCVVSVMLPHSGFEPMSYFRDTSLDAWLSQFHPFGSDDVEPTPEIPSSSTTSIWLFFCGITFARVGLWTADLAITQIMQEGVPEDERNTVFGVQNAICQLFSVLKDIAVILLPDVRTFGLLVVSSVVFVACGFLSYVIYLLRTLPRHRAATQPVGEDLLIESGATCEKSSAASD